MRRILITGFEPFGGQKINPSWESVKALGDLIGENQVYKMQLPTVYGKAAKAVIERAEQIKAEIVICVGQAGGRAYVSPEVIGINLRDCSLADNEGNLIQNQAIICDAPAAYFSTLPIREMIKNINDYGIESKLSYSAGAFVCNDVLYSLLHHFNGTQVRVGFIHLPFLPCQVSEGTFSMPLEKMIKALEIAILSL